MQFSPIIWQDGKLIQTLCEGGVVVMPTDTIYGIVGKALDESVVERIYEIKDRSENSPFIILIGSIEEIEKLTLELTLEQKNTISKFEGPTSFILESKDGSGSEKFKYLYRGQDGLSFRIPKEDGLRELLLKTGPLVAPSANPKGLIPAKSIEEAKKYFDNMVDMYIDGGEIEGKPSRLVQLYTDGKVSIIRE